MHSKNTQTLGMHYFDIIKFLQELQEFLQYLEDWEQYATSQVGFTAAQKDLMLLSGETREGIKIAGVHYNQ